jgi:hypothetical protein
VVNHEENANLGANRWQRSERPKVRPRNTQSLL